MNEALQFLQKLETEVRATRTIGEQTCSEFSTLPADDQLALAMAMQFIGCKHSVSSSEPMASPVPSANREQLIRLMLLKLYVDTGEPRWSSLILERLTETAIAIPGGQVGDLLHALFTMLGEDNFPITKPMANFLKQIVVLCFTKYRKLYAAVDFSWLKRSAFTPAQAYLVTFACPPSLAPSIRQAVIESLDLSPYKEEAINVLSDD